jgi:1-acyl-sn-glycerol-3-phosphate acyltransferase
MTANLASCALLALIAAASLAGVALSVVRSRLSFVQIVLWVLNRLLTQIRWRATASGPLSMPSGQGAVLVCNHTSSVDPFFIQALTTRKTHWMVAREFCEHPALRWFLKTCEVIPVSRGGIDTAATRAAIRIAAEGGIIGMLPEGKINMTDRLLLPARPGAALVALKARVPMIPCYIQGAPYDRVPWSPLFMTARVRIHFGQPLDLSEFFDREQDLDVVAEVLRRAMKAIAALAGQPDFEPQIAGRDWKPTPLQLETDMAASHRRRRARNRKP